MSTIDIRNKHEEVIKGIVFAETKSTYGEVQAYVIKRDGFRLQKYVSIYDGGGECVIITSKQHAEDLIKATNKAIELGWVE